MLFVIMASLAGKGYQIHNDKIEIVYQFYSTFLVAEPCQMRERGYYVDK